MRTCTTCGEEKPDDQYTRYGKKCNDCKRAGKEDKFQIMQRKLEALENEMRYKNARKQPGFKFKGEIPKPKAVGYYNGLFD